MKKLREEIAEVKSRNHTLLTLLQTGEMKEKHELMKQNQQLMNELSKLKSSQPVQKTSPVSAAAATGAKAKPKPKTAKKNANASESTAAKPATAKDGGNKAKPAAANANKKKPANKPRN